MINLNRYAVVFLHGSGSSGNDLRSFLEHVPIPSLEYNTFAKCLKEIDCDIFTPTANRIMYDGIGEYANVWHNRRQNWENFGVDDSYEDLNGISASSERVSERSNFKLFIQRFYC